MRDYQTFPYLHKGIKKQSSDSEMWCDIIENK